MFCGHTRVLFWNLDAASFLLCVATLSLMQSDDLVCYALLPGLNPVQSSR